MIDYNPKDWFTFIFRFHKADTVRQLFPMILTMAIYAAIVAYFEVSFWKIGEKSYVKNITVAHNILGFVISMLLVFRTNTAYDRWWEGRKQWGSLVNNSRNLAMKMAVLLGEKHDKDRQFFKKTIPAYAYALQNHLRSERTRRELGSNELALFPPVQESKSSHVPNYLAKLMFEKYYELGKSGVLSHEQMLSINPEISSFTDVCGACERVKNTPIPYSYSAFIKKFIFFYVMTMPFGFAVSLGYLVVPLVVFVFYVLASLELIAEEIEDPFEGDINDIPTDRIAANIHKHVFEIFA
jgi:ion channel-forming bestrophin family protein